MSMQTAGGGGARPTVHLHIGLPKTGAAPCQSLFDTRRADLRRAGLIYSTVGLTAHNHFDIAQAFLSGRVLPAGQRERVLGELETEIGAADAPLLISSEHFSDATDADVRAMAAFFGRGTRIVITLRQQVAYASAMYAEAIRWGHHLSFNLFLDAFRSALDYEPVVRRWEAGFGRTNVRIVSCDRHDGALGRALLDTMAPLGAFAWPDEPETPEALLPAALVQLQDRLSEGQPDGFALALETGLRGLQEDCVRHGVPLAEEWRIPDAFTTDFLALDRANDRLCRDYGLPFPLFGQTVTALLDANRRLGYAGSPASWLPRRRDSA